MGTNDAGPATDRLAIGAAQIAADVFDGRLDQRQVYRELARANDLNTFKIAGKLSVFVGEARAALRRRAQAEKDRSRPPEPAE